MVKNKLEVICQSWYDNDQMSGITIHLGFREYKTHLKSIEDWNMENNPRYPEDPIGDPILVELYAKEYRKLEKKKTIKFGFDYTNIESLMDKKVIKKVIG